MNRRCCGAPSGPSNAYNTRAASPSYIPGPSDAPGVRTAKSGATRP